jgi:hypothetical protein
VLCGNALQPYEAVADRSIEPAPFQIIYACIVQLDGGEGVPLAYRDVVERRGDAVKMTNGERSIIVLRLWLCALTPNCKTLERFPAIRKTVDVFEKKFS